MVLAARQAQDDHDLDGRTPRLERLVTEMNRDGGRILLPLFGAAALVLLIACGNTAALREVTDGSRNVGAVYGFDTFTCLEAATATGKPSAAKTP